VNQKGMLLPSHCRSVQMKELDTVGTTIRIESQRQPLGTLRRRRRLMAVPDRKGP